MKFYKYIIVIMMVSISISGCGEKYRSQGSLLHQEIHKNSINLGLCMNLQDCSEKFEILGGHGNRVNFSIYNVNDRNALATIIEFIVANGIKITKGVPISVFVYPKSRKDYGNYLFTPEPIMKVEIIK